MHAMADAPTTVAPGEAADPTHAPSRPTAPDDNTKLVVELLQKTYWEGANLMLKGTAFYMAILAALVGYVVTQKVQTQIAELTLYGGVATSALAVTVAIMAARTMYRCVGVLEHLLLRQATQSIAESELRTVFSRWRKTIWSFGVCGTLLVIMFVSGMFVLLKSLDQIGPPRQQQSAQPSNATRSVQP